MEQDLEPNREFMSRFKTKCLIGRVILCYSYPLQEHDVRASLLDSWKCKKDFSVSTVSHNTFIFRFEEHQDCMHVLLNVPWNVRGGLLILSPWKPGQKPESFNFDFSPFWVQVHKLPQEYMTPENGVKIGNVLGRFMYSERNTPCRSSKALPPAREFLRLRVVLDIREPLRTQYLVKRTGLSDIWIQFRYENLGVFCFKCGLIGNYHWGCNHPRGIGTAKYNSLLSAPPCSDAPLIRFSQMNTVLKESSDSDQEKEKDSEEESPDQIFDISEIFSERVPQMNTMLEKSSDLEQEILSQLEKVSEKEKNSEDESNVQMFDSGENNSARVPQINTMLEESSDLGQEILSKLENVSDKEKDSEDESNDQMFDSVENFSTRVPHKNTLIKKEKEKEDEEEKEKNSQEESLNTMVDAKENFSTRSGMQMLVMNGLVTMVMILNYANMHRQVAVEIAKADHGNFENWKWLLENWKMTVAMAVYFAYLGWMLTRVAPNSWFVQKAGAVQCSLGQKKLGQCNVLPKMKGVMVS